MIPYQFIIDVEIFPSFFVFVIEQCISLFRGLDAKYLYLKLGWILKRRGKNKYIIGEIEIEFLQNKRGDWFIWKIIYFCFFFCVENNVTDEKFLGMKKRVILIDLRRGHQMEQLVLNHNFEERRFRILIFTGLCQLVRICKLRCLTDFTDLAIVKIVIRTLTTLTV